MKKRSKFGYNLRRLIRDIFFWIVIALMYPLFRFVGLSDNFFSVSVEKTFDPIYIAIVYVGAGALLGILFFILEVIIPKAAKRKRSFSFIILLQTFLFVLVLMLVIISVNFSTRMAYGEEASVIWDDTLRFFKTWTFISLLSYAGIASMFVSFIKQTSHKLGPGILFKMIMGRYHKPREENRIFIFLDLKDSTTHAERLGHIVFSRLLQECFYDLTDVLWETKGEVYQFVGDEVVVSWPLKEGVENGNCLRFFFEYRKVILKRQKHYLGHYGVIPTFKAGLDCGLVAVAEVGEVKREIAYHGDTLNTAARIQGQCNFNGKLLLISANIKALIEHISTYNIEVVGNIPLKGKLAPVDIYSVELRDESTD